MTSLSLSKPKMRPAETSRIPAVLDALGVRLQTHKPQWPPGREKVLEQPSWGLPLLLPALLRAAGTLGPPDGGGFPTSHHWFWGEDATQLPCTGLVVPAEGPS